MFHEWQSICENFPATQKKLATRYNIIIQASDVAASIHTCTSKITHAGCHTYSYITIIPCALRQCRAT